LSANQLELSRYGTSNPEEIVYINNCAIALQEEKLKQGNVNIYTIAVVVPYYHNQGRIAAEMLKGIAQLQLQINWHIFCQAKLEKEFGLSSEAIETLINTWQTNPKIALRVLITNDPNNLYDPLNQTATALVKLVHSANIMAVIGHYSSEMTATALTIYAEHGMPLINSSSTSDELSNLSIGNRMAFYRLNSPDRVNAKYLIDTLAAKLIYRTAIKVAIIYNQNSSYSKSYYRRVVNNLEERSPQFTLLTPFQYLSADYYQIRDYLNEINRQKVDIIIIIADGGVEPNSMNNVGAIINQQNCWIVGSATLYQENVLHWLDGQNVESTHPRIMACVPWHWDSARSGDRSDNFMSQQFCKLGTHLWGKGNLTWRSATTFDAGWLIVNTLVEYQRQNSGTPLKNSAALLEQMNRDFQLEKLILQGVTGQISFDPNSGDRLQPPTEIACVKYDSDRQKWLWTCDPQL
jgi:branched-chain amino acid transport system substrate-binding protein